MVGYIIVLRAVLPNVFYFQPQNNIILFEGVLKTFNVLLAVKELQ